MKKKIIAIGILATFLLFSTLTASANTIISSISLPQEADYKYFEVTVKDKKGTPVKGATVYTFNNPWGGGLRQKGETNSRGKVTFIGGLYTSGCAVTIYAEYGKHRATEVHDSYVVGKAEVNLKFEDLELKPKKCITILELLFEHSFFARLFNFK